jgi:acyl transferase domain-containing protein
MPSLHLGSHAEGPVPVAIIGIGCRLPGNVNNPEDLWELLCDGRNTWSPVPPDRFNEDAFHHPDPDHHGTTNHLGGHFITHQNVAAFDAAFFGISPIEAQAMDPQQRFLLETTYEAFENAGIAMDTIRGSDTAVYTAMFTRDYDRNILRDPSDMPKYHVTGSGEAIIANRISYTFDFRGPSIALDTGCSGSLVALHQACQSLRTGESSIAIASGVNLILNPDHMFGMSNLQLVSTLLRFLRIYIELTCDSMLSDTGRSYSFDTRGSGYGRGEGVVSVVLKRLDDALQSGDHIRAIIRNTGVNQDGKTNGITMPSLQAQKSLQKSIYGSSSIHPHQVQFVEAHGTGTLAGMTLFTSILQTGCRSVIDKSNIICHLL